MNLDQVTFIIKTIHRPWACNRLIKSIQQYAPEARIHLLDDGKPKLRFVANYPDTAATVDRVIHSEFDIGISDGRNRLLDSCETPYFVLLDNDHVLTPKTDMLGLLDKLVSLEDQCDLLAIGGGSVPRCFVHNQQRMMYANKQTRRTDGDIEWCDLVTNAFIAKVAPCREVRWLNRLRVYEHWDFFLRAFYADIKVALAKSHFIEHRHMSNIDYNPLRARGHYKALALSYHNLRGFEWRNPPRGSQCVDIKEELNSQRISS